MKRPRTDCCNAAAIFVLLIVSIALGWPDGGRAEQPLPATSNLSRTLSREKLERVGDYIRPEIAAGTIPGAVILIQQHGHPVYFESFGVRDIASGRPMTADMI